MPNVLRLPNDGWQFGAILYDPQNEAKVSVRHRLRLATVGEDSSEIDVGRVYYALFTSKQRSWKNAFRAE